MKSSKFLNKDLGFFKEPSESRQSFLTSLQMICLRILQIISVLLIHPQLVADLTNINPQSFTEMFLQKLGSELCKQSITNVYIAALASTRMRILYIQF